MSGEFKFDKPISVQDFEKLVIDSGYVVDKETRAHFGLPYFNVSQRVGNNTVVWIILNKEGTHVVDLVRYGGNDPTWLIDLMMNHYSIDIGEL